MVVPTRLAPMVSEPSLPRAMTHVITVGAVNTMGTSDRTDDVIASYSSKGPTYIDRVVKLGSCRARKPGHLSLCLRRNPPAAGVTKRCSDVALSEKRPGRAIGTYLALSRTAWRHRW